MSHVSATRSLSGPWDLLNNFCFPFSRLWWDQVYSIAFLSDYLIIVCISMLHPDLCKNDKLCPTVKYETMSNMSYLAKFETVLVSLKLTMFNMKVWYWYIDKGWCQKKSWLRCLLNITSSVITWCDHLFMSKSTQNDTFQ